MSIEIQQPELERRVREGLQEGRFQNADELLTKALDALSESSDGQPKAWIGRIAPPLKACRGK